MLRSRRGERRHELEDRARADAAAHVRGRRLGLHTTRHGGRRTSRRSLDADDAPRGADGNCLLVALPFLKGRLPRDRDAWLWTGVSGVLMVTVFLAGFTEAIIHAGPGNAIVLATTSPFWVVLLARVWFGERASIAALSGPRARLYRDRPDRLVAARRRFRRRREGCGHGSRAGRGPRLGHRDLDRQAAAGPSPGHRRRRTGDGSVPHGRCCSARDLVGRGGSQRCRLGLRELWLAVASSRSSARRSRRSPTSEHFAG